MAEDDGQVEFVKRTLMDDYAGFGHTVSSVAKTHANLMRRGRPTDHYRRSAEWIATLTKADIQKAVDDLLGTGVAVIG